MRPNLLPMSCGAWLLWAVVLSATLPPKQAAAQSLVEPMASIGAPAPASYAAPPQTSSSGVAVNVHMLGFVGVGASPSTGIITFGGPRLELAAGDFACALSFFPSLIYSKLFPEGRLRPQLGAGPALRFRWLVFFMPVYWIESRYVPVPGLGYQF